MRLGTGAVWVVLLLPMTGCALFGKKEPDAVKDPGVSAFEEERTEGEKMSDFAASAGRANPYEKKKAAPGDTFLFSDKAKEIYNNTER